MKIQEQDFEIYRGDDTTFILDVRDSRGRKIDFAGADLKMRLESKTHKVDFSLGKGLAVIDGDVNLVFSHELTKDWNFRSGKYDMQMIDSSGKVKTILKGEVKVVYDITP